MNEKFFEFNQHGIYIYIEIIGVGDGEAREAVAPPNSGKNFFRAKFV